MKKENIKIEIGDRYRKWTRFFQISRFLLMLLFVELTIGYHVNAQDSVTSGCNRSVRFNQYLEKLPKEVCLPQGNYFVFGIFDKTDVNNDGLDDCIFCWCKYPYNDGDTTFVSFYKQNSDSTYSLFKTLDNLYPIYLKSYNDLYTPKEEELRIIQKNYYYRYPLYELKIEKDKIIIELKNDAESNLIITYQYDKDLKNWKYIDCIESFFYNDGINKLDFSNELGPTIDNFKYTF